MIVKRLLVSIAVMVLIAGTANAVAKDKNKNKPLPPGLEKRAEQGKPLPPGWQKKLSKGDFLQDDIYLRGKIVIPLGSDGVLSIEVEGSVIKLHEKTREIIDIIF